VAVDQYHRYYLRQRDEEPKDGTIQVTSVILFGDGMLAAASNH